MTPNRDMQTNLCIFLTVTWLLLEMKITVSDPQTNQLGKGCSTYFANNLSDFYSNLNGTFLDLKDQLNGTKHFATAQRILGSDPVYGMVQCRNYMSTADCLACFAVAETQIRNCSTSNGARVIYDGCFLRYEGMNFYGEGTRDANDGYCGNRTASQAGAFETTVRSLLGDLQIATPRIKGFYAASTRAVGGGGNATVYAMAQCVDTITENDCAACMAVAYGNLDRCPPQANGRAVDSGCFVRYSDRPFFGVNQTIDITPFLKTKGSSSNVALIAGVAGGGGLLLLIIAMLVWFRLSRKRKASPRGDILGATELRGPQNYHYNDLKSATRNFSEENKLGEGGFGDVYKGTLKNGKIVAVKKLALAESRRARADFESEVKLISNVHHRNLIRLLGCCSKKIDLLLVYEYMANSSLDKFLFGERKGSLNWQQRFDVILGTARGIAYLHDEFHVCIIHRDIKSSNILLDDDFQAKIADFGLARLLPENQSHLSTKFAGTLGYTAPEYAVHGQLSEKVDTYSFGIVVLEIISGQKSNEVTPDTENEFLLKRAWRLYENENHMELVDKSIDPSEYIEEDVKKIVEIALMCTQSTASLRPTMSEIVVLLKSKGSLLHRPPTRPAFIDPEHRVREEKSTSTASSASNATVSITQFSGR